MTDVDPRFRTGIPEIHRPYAAAAERYDATRYRQVGTSGLFLPPVSLGLWWNFGDNIPFDRQRAVLRHAFDVGISHFDLANNYGPPYGSAETNFGRMMREDFAPYRDELLISSKAGYDFWPGPYGNWGSRKHIIASAESSLRRMGLDYVDVFYSHRVDAVTPIEETVGALDTLVRQGKALYVGISSYSAERTAEAVAVARSLGTPLVIHQPAYSLLNRWVVPVQPSIVDLAASHRLVITIEDGIRVGGVGTRVRQVLREAGVDTAVDELGLPDEFIDHATREQILEDAGLTAAKIAQDVVSQVLGTRIPKARPEGSDLSAVDDWESTPPRP